MPQVAVEKVHDGGTASASVFDEMNNLFEEVRRRAFGLFQKRAGAPGSEIDDWLKAERELIWAPESDLVEKDGKFDVQIAVPGFDVKDMQVTATPDMLIVRAEATHEHEQNEANVHFCEFGNRQLFRQFHFPAPIDVDKVTANLDKGILRISAAKEEAKSQKTVAAAA